MQPPTPRVTSNSPVKTKYASSSRVCVWRGTLIPGTRPASRRQYVPPVSLPDKQMEPIIAFEAIEIVRGDRSEIVRTNHTPGEPDGVDEERPPPERCLFTGEDLRFKKVAELGCILIAAEQV